MGFVRTEVRPCIHTYRIPSRGRGCAAYHLSLFSKILDDRVPGEEPQNALPVPPFRASPSTAGLPHPLGPQPAGSAWEQVLGSTYIFAVFRLGEVDQVIVVHVLGVEQVTVLLLAEVFRVNPVGPEEFLVRHTECLPYGLCDQLGL